MTNPAESPEYTLFVGSPGDVSAERQAVFESAANVENDTPFGFRLRVVRWEDLVAPDFGRGQAIVFEATHFDTIDIFLGIFWSRLGTPPGTNEAGEAFASGSVEEFERAKELRRKGKLKRLMVYFCTRECPPAADPAQWEKLRAWRDGMLKDPAHHGICGHYKELTEFQLHLERDLRRVCRELAEAEGRVPRQGALGPHVHRMCDRAPQTVEFGRRFSEHVRERPGLPQIYLLAGGTDDAHESFIKRLAVREVPAILQGLAPAGKPPRRVVTPEPKLVEWPLDRRRFRTQLPALLFNQLGDVAGTDLSPAALFRLQDVVRHPVLVIHHPIDLGAPDDPALDDLAWYVGEYWRDLAPDPARTQLVVIASLACAFPAGARPLRGAVRPDQEAMDALDRRLQTLAGSAQGCSVEVLPPLEAIGPRMVLNWFSMFTEWGEDERAEFVEGLFKDAGQSLNMAKVESALRKVMRTPPGAETLLRTG